jgi:hypothetical protein
MVGLNERRSLLKGLIEVFLNLLSTKLRLKANFETTVTVKEITMSRLKRKDLYGFRDFVITEFKCR